MLDILFQALVRYAAPVLVFTAEEVWGSRFPQGGSVHLLEWPDLPVVPADDMLFARWNATELNSYLIEITAEVLHQQDATTGHALVDMIQDAAAQKGTGAWTVQTALDLGVPVSGIAEATFARAASSSAAARAAVREAGLDALRTLTAELAEGVRGRA